MPRFLPSHPRGGGLTARAHESRGGGDLCGRLTFTQDFRFGAVGKSIIPLWEAVAGRLGAVGEAVYNGPIFM